MDNITKKILFLSRNAGLYSWDKPEDKPVILNRLVLESDSLGNKLLVLSRDMEKLKSQWETANKAGDQNKTAQIEKTISRLWVQSIKQMEDLFDDLHHLI